MNLTAKLQDLRRDKESPDVDFHFPSAQLEGVFSNGRPARLAVHPDGKPLMLLPVSVTDLAKKIPECDGLSITSQKYKIAGSGRQDFVEIKCESAKLESVFVNMMENICDRIRAGSSAISGLNGSVADFRDLLITSRQSVDRKKALGLFGEVLAAMNIAPKIKEIAEFWTGPIGHRRDFCLPGAAVEVKTSEKTDSRVVQISSLGQLDCDDFEKLFLLYFKVEEHPSRGKCIGDLVCDLQGVIRSDGCLREKLAAAGYDGTAKQAYDAYFWRVMESRVYCVKDGFPRVIGSSFAGGKPAGVLDITYAVDLDQAVSYEVGLDALMEGVTF